MTPWGWSRTRSPARARPSPAAIHGGARETKDYEGVTGKIAYPDGSHVPSKPVAIMHVEDGKMSLETTVTPEA